MILSMVFYFEKEKHQHSFNEHNRSAGPLVFGRSCIFYAMAGRRPDEQ
jgi:hypothetical protein